MEAINHENERENNYAEESAFHGATAVGHERGLGDLLLLLLLCGDRNVTSCAKGLISRGKSL